MLDGNKKLYISMYHYTRDLGHSCYPEIKGLDTSNCQTQYWSSGFLKKFV